MSRVRVSGGSGNLMVETDECRFQSGDLAFPPISVPDPFPLPEWYSAPNGCTHWDVAKPRNLSLPCLEVFSGKDGEDEVLTFYESCVARGGLIKSPTPPVVRVTPGFQAANVNYAFSIDLYRHKEVTFWTVQLLSIRPMTAVPGLRLLDRNGERVILQNMETSDTYIVPASALTDFKVPDYVERHSEAYQTETIPWSSLPTWTQFAFEFDDCGELYWDVDREGWSASIELNLGNVDHRDVFEACLNRLDALGFDGIGVERRNHSYYVSVLQYGHSLNASVCSESGDRGSLTLLNTLGYVSAFLRYSPPCKFDVKTDSANDS